jgi:agmatinase/guanidinopropionase
VKANPALGADQSAFSGITTFMRQSATRELKDVDVAIVGVPFDGGATSFRSGSRFGPRKIRELSVIQWGYNHAMRVAPLDVLRVVDYGDVDVVLTDIQQNIKIVAAEVARILKAGPRIIALGGDHSVSYPLLRAHAKKYGPLAVVHFDSHSDCSRESVDHGSPFRQAIDDGLIDVDAYVQVGIRGPRHIPDAIEIAEAMGAKVLTIDRCFEIGIPEVIRTVRAAIGSRRVYVSLDIDAVDPAYAPAAGTPEVGGFTAHQMLQMVRGLRGLNLVGCDVVEVCPPYDNPGEITSVLAANLVFELLSLLAIGVEAGK